MHIGCCSKFKWAGRNPHGNAPGRRQDDDLRPATGLLVGLLLGSLLWLIIGMVLLKLLFGE